MVTNYGKHAGTRQTPQSDPIPGRADMVLNEAGGWCFAVDNWKRLERFLILGCEAGSYYASEKKMTLENATAVTACLKEDGLRVVNRIVEISEAGRAPKNDSAIFALAMASACDIQAVKDAALAAITKVCRIPTHLFAFCSYSESMRGWGRSLRRAVGSYYLSKTPDDLAFAACKYQSRDGWSHRDVLRLCHISSKDPSTQAVLRWITHGPDSLGPLTITRNKGGVEHVAQYGGTGNLPSIIPAFEAAKKATTIDEICDLIGGYHLPRECIPTRWLTEARVWEMLLERMPMTAMIRNLATMTRVGLLTAGSKATAFIQDHLRTSEVRRARIHPIAVLTALLTYQQGHGERGQNTWTPVPQIIDALDAGFYSSFENVEPTGLRWCLGLDVSGSMAGTSVAGMPFLKANVAQCAMALITAATEKEHVFQAFDTRLFPITISPRQRLDDVCKTVAAVGHGGTDCSLPITWATEKKVPVDVFLISTDSQSWQGSQHPTQAIAKYRQVMGIPAKLAVVAMAASQVSIADPADGGQMDFAGLDANLPGILNEFARGNI